MIKPAQIGRMLQLASGLTPSPRSPLRGPATRLAVVLLYTAGLRIGELLRLTIGDVEDKGAVLRIRESKFHKSRFVPLSPSASRELKDYLRQRGQVFPTENHASLLCSHRRKGPKGYSHPGMQCAIGRLYVAANVRDEQGRYPRVHDMRHSFALQALIRWYRAGADVQSMLPKLALFMGHVSIESSAYYLRWVPTLRRLASDRFESQFGQLVA
ncbi:MAG: tyrosine-type recombinase/integrase [Opitutaceae bacterium]